LIIFIAVGAFAFRRSLREEERADCGSPKGKDDATVDEAFGRVGKRVIENTGPLDTKRMETVDEEFLASALDFMDRKTKEGKPWFCYMNTTRMHIWTHLKPSSVDKTGLAS
jgi:arylsulfatase A-like enzyme